jgi:hypothetical protein
VSVNVSLVSAGNQNVPLVGRSNARRAFIYSKAELPFVIVWGELMKWTPEIGPNVKV